MPIPVPMHLLTFGTLSMIVLCAAAPAGAANSSRPNVLLICADDHAAYVCGANGNRQVRTPRLDQLAREGIRFERAYCNSPVCTASRQSFLTGRYPRSLGVTQLKTALPESETTLAEMLKGAGYDTGAIGKMHFNSESKHGFDLRLDTADHARILKERGPTPIPSGLDVLPPWKPFRDPAAIWLNGSYKPFGAVDADMTGTWFAEEAGRFLGSPREAPFFLVVSFTEPHSPFHFPIEYHGRHDPAEFAVPTVSSDDDWQIPDIFRDLTVREKQGIIASYYTSVEFLDKNVGLVLDALEKSGKSKETIVVYLGDHGYMLGQHGRFEKHCCFEPAVRAPLLMRFPGRIAADLRTSALTEFIDIAPTVLEFCGLDISDRIQGKSLVPLIKGEKPSHREFVVSEYSENAEAMIRTSRWKLVYGTGARARQDGYATGRPLPGRTIRLFDMEDDPDENRNRAGEPERAVLVSQLISQLGQHMQRTARQPELIPQSHDPQVILDFCLEPRDVVNPANR